MRQLAGHRVVEALRAESLGELVPAWAWHIFVAMLVDFVNVQPFHIFSANAEAELLVLACAFFAEGVFDAVLVRRRLRVGRILLLRNLMEPRGRVKEWTTLSEGFLVSKLSFLIVCDHRVKRLFRWEPLAFAEGVVLLAG